MGAPKVRLNEVDLSTRVPSFRGVYGGIVIPAKKGAVNESTLVTSDTELLRYFTPDERIEVGFDVSYYSALSFLEKSDKLWVVRAAKDALYGGAVVKSLASATSNFQLQAGIADPDAFVFDSQPDVDGVAEVTDVTARADASGDLNNKYFVFSTPTEEFYAWFNVNAGGTDPNVAGRTAIPVAIAIDETADNVAAALKTAIEASAANVTVAIDASKITITNGDNGNVDDAADLGTTGFTISTTTQGVTEVDSTDESVLFYGANQGEWNDKIGFTLKTYDTYPDDVKEEGAFLVSVYKFSNQLQPVEEFICSRDETKLDGYNRNIFVDEIMGGSNFLRGRSNTAVDSAIQPKDQDTILWLNGGDDGTAVTDAEMIIASNVLANKEETPVTVFMDGGWTTPAYQKNLDTICAARFDCVACLSVPYADEAASTFMNDIVDFRKTELNLSSSFSALYTPHAKIYDRFNDRTIFVPPSGYAAAAISAVGASMPLWYPPAGFRRGSVNVLDLRRRYTSGQMDLLHDSGINPLRFTAGRGIHIWGQKTLLSRPSALDRLNVRLLLCVIEPSIMEALEDFMFEFNDEVTRSQVTSILESKMDSVQAQRGVSSYSVVCNESNNTPEEIDNNKLVVWLFAAPNRSVEDIPFSVAITRSGVDFSLLEQAL